ncbi:MATE family efflux transporter [Tyzzerella sp. OttesenSCG-928-J15]|nr:MATE family efflux transporter [Tyzzerella sp. OttesenSCG-928-J15]
MTKDLTEGNIVKTLVLFSLPLILSGLLQQLYNWADAFIVGNVEGELQLAAIGATGVISGLLVNMITGFTVGINILAARQYGAGLKGSLKNLLATFTIVLGALFLIAAALAVIFTGPILRLLHTPDDIFQLACNYLRIIFIGTPFIVIYNIYAAVLRGMGDSRTPFLAIIVSAFTNIILDILLVALLRFGVTGAAVATVASQAMMTLFIFLYSKRKYPELKFKFERESIDKSSLSSGLRLSIPTAIQSSLNSLGGLLLQNFMNGFGTQTVAAITTAYRIDSIIMLPIFNLGAGISTITAQNAGAGNFKRAKKSLWAGIMLMSAVSIALTAIIIPSGATMISIFGVSGEAVEIGARFFQIIAMFYLPFSISIAIRGYLQGVGDVVFSGIVTIAALIIRIGLSYILKEPFGNEVIAYAEVFSWLALLAMCIARFLYISKTGKVEIGEKN